MTISTSFSELSRRLQEVVGSLEASARDLPSAENRELLAVSEHAREEVAACRKGLENSFVTVSGGRKLRMVEHEALRAFARANQTEEEVVFDSVTINDAGRVTEGNFTSASVTDISPLAGLTALTDLYLADTKVTDLSPVTRPGLRVIR